MNKLPAEQRARIIGMMAEGVSIRSIVRLTGVAKNTVAKLLRDAGEACLDYQDRTLRDLPCRRIQCDEIWSYVYAKAKNVPTGKSVPEGAGDIWTWTALGADTKLVPCWHVGRRDADAAEEFMLDLAGRLRGRVQLTTDGHKAYLEAVEGAFGADVDHAMLVKLYGEAPDGSGSPAQCKCSPAECTGIHKTTIADKPDADHVSTSFAERQNLTMRMCMRRFTRPTNAFSKKVESHMHAQSIYFMHYNFMRIHQTLRVTPAMAAGVTDRLWKLGNIVALIDEAAPKPGKRGPYQKKEDIQEEISS